MRTEDPLIRASLIGTAAFVAVAAAAVVLPDTLAVAMVVVSLLLFAAGCVAFVLTLLRAAERSRREAVTLPGIWWLSGSAPTPVRRLLIGSFLVEVLVAFGAASVRPFTGLAFGILAPIYGLGLLGLWGARHGTFGPRTPRSPV